MRTYLQLVTLFLPLVRILLGTWFKKTFDGGASSTADEKGIKKNMGYEENGKSWP